MSALRVLCIHGLATSSADALAFERDVELTLFQNHIPAVVELGCWNSSGSILGDLYLLSRKQASVVDELRGPFRSWLKDLHPTEPALVLGHSFGSVVARRLVAESATELRARAGKTTLMCLANPSHHPLLGLGLPRATAVGLGFPAVGFLNREDRVAAFKGRYRSLANDGWVTTEVHFPKALPDPTRAHSGIVAGLRHDPLSYLRNRLVLRGIAIAAGMDTVDRPLPEALGYAKPVQSIDLGMWSRIVSKS